MFSSIDPAADAFAAQWLPDLAWRAFRRQSAYERQHSVALARRLLSRQPDVDRAVVVSALLHDLGKSEARLAPWHRTAYVLLSAWPSRPLRRLRQPPPRSPLYPLWVLQRHPMLGAKQLEASGLSERSRWLIAHHHDRIDDPDLQLLQAVDSGR